MWLGKYYCCHHLHQHPDIYFSTSDVPNTLAGAIPSATLFTTIRTTTTATSTATKTSATIIPQLSTTFDTTFNYKLCGGIILELVTASILQLLFHYYIILITLTTKLLAKARASAKITRKPIKILRLIGNNNNKSIKVINTTTLFSVLRNKSIK